MNQEQSKVLQPGRHKPPNTASSGAEHGGFELCVPLGTFCLCRLMIDLQAQRC